MGIYTLRKGLDFCQFMPSMEEGISKNQKHFSITLPDWYDFPIPNVFPATHLMQNQRRTMMICAEISQKSI